MVEHGLCCAHNAVIILIDATGRWEVDVDADLCVYEMKRNNGKRIKKWKLMKIQNMLDVSD